MSPFAHVRQFVDLRQAFAFAPQPGVVLTPLVHLLAPELCDPCLDVPGRDEHGDVLRVCPRRDPLLPAGILQLANARRRAPSVSIRHGDEPRTASRDLTTILLHFLRKLLPHILVRSATTAWRHLDAESVPQFAAPIWGISFQESANEHLLLAVLTEQNDLRRRTHKSHPLASSSDSFRPPADALSFSTLASRSAVVAPDTSRRRRIPRSPPR